MIKDVIQLYTPIQHSSAVLILLLYARFDFRAFERCIRYAITIYRARNRANKARYRENHRKKSDIERQEEREGYS